MQLSCRTTLSEHSGYVTAVAVSPDGKTVVSSSGDQSVKLWDVAGGKCRATLPSSANLNAVAFSPDGKMVVTGDDDKTVKLWE